MPKIRVYVDTSVFGGVNYDRIRKYNAVNLLKGYRLIEIRSPAEVAYGDEAQEV